MGRPSYRADRMLKAAPSVVLALKQSSTYPRGYASGCFSPAALLDATLSILRFSYNLWHMSTAQLHDLALARTLILDEMFDLALYREFHAITDGPLRDLLTELIRVEETHVSFWQQFFETSLRKLDLPRRLKLRLIVWSCRLFGAPAIHLMLEAIEVYGVRKYLSIWKMYKDQPLGSAVKGILIDEFKHEDIIVSQMTERKINPERIRNVFLGSTMGWWKFWARSADSSAHSAAPRWCSLQARPQRSPDPSPWQPVSMWRSALSGRSKPPRRTRNVS
jgi:hypothetical protein